MTKETVIIKEKINCLIKVLRYIRHKKICYVYSKIYKYKKIF